MEDNSDNVYLGRQIHDKSYEREDKEILIDNRIAIDFVGQSGIINEVKKSDKVEKAHKFQLLYYIYYLKQKGASNVKGIIRYPKLRKKVEVELNTEAENKLQQVLGEIEGILSQPKPPRVENSKNFCKKCSYYELCWV